MIINNDDRPTPEAYWKQRKKLIKVVFAQYLKKRGAFRLVKMQWRVQHPKSKIAVSQLCTSNEYFETKHFWGHAQVTS